ncbi:hypothetical protein AeRB84_021396 [Aphanomyces euteiches]|nr:hypothetical protein AeRB84_021396 [Aphanomyces euteiches]
MQDGPMCGRPEFFQDAAKTLSAWIWNFGGNTIDMSLASYPTWIKYLSISNANTINLPTPFDCHAATLLLKDIKSLTTPTTWYSELTGLTLENVNLKTLPALPNTLTALHVQRNSLSSVAELKSLPSSITLLNVSQNAYTELSSINWRNLRRLYLQSNTKLTQIVNVTFSSQLVYLQVKGLVLSNWMMDANTYQVLSQLQAERIGPGGTDDTALLGYNAADSTIASDPLDCSSANGAVCVLQGTSTTSASPLATTTTAVPETSPTPVVSIAGSSVSPVVTASSGGNSTLTTDIPTANSTPKPTISSNSSSQSGSTSGPSSPSSSPSPLSPSSQSSPESSSSNTGVIAGASVGGVALVAIIVGVFIFRRRQQNAKDVTLNGFATTLTPTVTTTGKEDAALNLEGLAMVRVEEREVELHSILGTGAFADVWLGSFQGSPVAIKKMHRHRATPTQLESFVREIQLMAQFDSPYIVSLIGAAWTRPSDLKCVMELMDGGDLRDCLNATTSQTLSWRVKIDHIHSIVEALVYLHSLNIVHRDIKSRNVLLDSSKPAKLTDFGISKEDIPATMTVGVGTFRWMAPEVIQCQNYTVAADIYSFVMVLSEFDTHLIPYEDVTNSVNGEPLGDTLIMVQVVAGTLKPSFSHACPAWIRDLAMQCLSFNPSERPTAMQLSYIVRTKMKALNMST